MGKSLGSTSFSQLKKECAKRAKRNNLKNGFFMHEELFLKLVRNWHTNSIITVDVKYLHTSFIQKEICYIANLLITKELQIY